MSRGKVFSPMLVLVAPGQTTLMRMSHCASSTAAILAKVTWAALEQEYEVKPKLEKMRLPLTEETTTMLPPPAARRWGMAYLTVRKVPRTLMLCV